MENISWTACVKNEEVLQRVKEERNVLRKIRQRKRKWIGHSSCRNYLIKNVIGQKMKERGNKEGVIRIQVLDDLTEKTRYRNLKAEELDCTVRRTRFGRGYGPVLKTDYETNEIFSNFIVNFRL